MTRVKILREVANHKVDEIVELAPSAAAYLVNAGYAEEADTKAEQPKRGRPRSSRTASDDE